MMEHTHYSVYLFVIHHDFQLCQSNFTVVLCVIQGRLHNERDLLSASHNIAFLRQASHSILFTAKSKIIGPSHFFH